MHVIPLALRLKRESLLPYLISVLRGTKAWWWTGIERDRLPSLPFAQCQALLLLLDPCKVDAVIRVVNTSGSRHNLHLAIWLPSEALSLTTTIINH